MTKRKIIFYSAVLLILLSFLTAGTIGTLMGNTYKNNEVYFYVDDVKAYCKIEGKFYYKHSTTEYAEVKDTAYKAYNQTYYPSAEYANNAFEGFEKWDDLPDAKFNIDKRLEVYKYEIVITNLNPTMELSAQLKNVIVGEDTSDGELLFYTTITYKLDNQEPVVKFSNKDEGVNLNLYQDNSLKVSLVKDDDAGVDNSQTIAVNSKLTISIEIERKTNVKPIDGDVYTNNFSIALDAIEPTATEGEEE